MGVTINRYIKTYEFVQGVTIKHVDMSSAMYVGKHWDGLIEDVHYTTPLVWDVFFFFWGHSWVPGSFIFGARQHYLDWPFLTSKRPRGCQKLPPESTGRGRELELGPGRCWCAALRGSPAPLGRPARWWSPLKMG